MTYFYLFETNDYVYCGQHRIADNKDPMKDSYKGSGRDWNNYLKENGWWLIKDFRKNVKKTILEVVMDDGNRTCIGNVEKYWIEWSKETYGDKCLNVSKGSSPNYRYDTIEEAEEAKKTSRKVYYQTPEGKALHKTYQKAYREVPEMKAYFKDYNRAWQQSSKGKQNNKVRQWAYTNNYPNPSVAKLPKKWSEEDKQEYIRQYNKHIY